MYKLTQKRLETLKSKKLARELSKLNYLSYDTLFVKIGAVLFSEKIHKVGQFSVSRKSAKYVRKYQHPHSMYSKS